MASAKPASKAAAPLRDVHVKKAKAADGGASTRAKAATPAARKVVTVVEAQKLHLFDPQSRISIIRQGIPASSVGSLSARMGMPKEALLSSLGLSRATISRKERAAALLSKDESERVLGVESMIGMVQRMVEESGDPVHFDAARWLSEWLAGPLPALGGETPASYMDTFEGQRMVADLLAMTQSGAYA
ncbi:antitoxin Xre-like helix-turn-helix domain-containing protein [Massilia endophytica]|uniref:antitoxin Xre-like helix-turn-helix domain-containing protein n=1 Tax=Massilia endophytica TaxID=2899220 RepID=UPI001E58FCB7|nr:antitoxin Xre-like helix-turn-helix domain-containing protein [Massilia endophytica]UGQ48873.1 MbcA/ParS/Xre antitoxin family protein [Massilia endophytica]